MITKRQHTLLNYLRDNSRISLTKVSKETGIPLSTLVETLKKLEQDVVHKHVTLLDFSKLGYGMKVQFQIKTREKEKLKEFLLKHNSVNNLHTIMGDIDFFAECYFKNLMEVTDFKEQLNKYDVQMNEHFVVDEVKKESFALSLENLQEK